MDYGGSRLHACHARMDYGGSRLLLAFLLLHHVQPLPFLWVGIKNMFLYINNNFDNQYS